MNDEKPEITEEEAKAILDKKKQERAIALQTELNALLEKYQDIGQLIINFFRRLFFPA